MRINWVRIATSSACLFCSSAWGYQTWGDDNWSLNNHLSLYGEFVYMRRFGTSEHSIVNDSNKKQHGCCPTFRVMDTKNLVHRFHWVPGYRVGIIYMPNKWRSFEASYLQVGEWHSHDVKRATHASPPTATNGSLSFPFKHSTYTYDFTKANKAVARYSSDFSNAELNYWSHASPRRADYFSISGILGFRYVDLREHFKISFTRYYNTSHYDIRTKNHLYGLQIGGNLQFTPLKRLSWDATLKMGAARAYLKQKTFLGDYNNLVTLRDFSRSLHHVAYFVDGSLALAYQLWSHLNIHGGYEFFYFSGMALAPGQIDRGTGRLSGSHVHDHGTFTMQAAFAGLTFSF